MSFHCVGASQFDQRSKSRSLRDFWRLVGKWRVPSFEVAPQNRSLHLAARVGCSKNHSRRAWRAVGAIRCRRVSTIGAWIDERSWRAARITTGLISRRHSVTSIFIGESVKSLEEDRRAVVAHVSGWGLSNHGRESIAAGPDLRSALRDEIGSADLFLGIYASDLPMSSSAPWYQDLIVALECKSDQEILLFRQYSDSVNWLENDIWRNVDERGLSVPTFRDRESLLLHVSKAIARHSPDILRHIVEQIGQMSPENRPEIRQQNNNAAHDPIGNATLATIFDLGTPAYNLVYGRRSSRPRKEFGSLVTFSKYFETYARLQINFPGILVEPDVPHDGLARQGAMLLSGPSTSDLSKEYFARMASRGIDPFCGSCVNHLKEKCHQLSSACAPGRNNGATGCAHVAGTNRVYTFRDSPPAEEVKHVAMLVRSPSPWSTWNDDAGQFIVPRIIFASGCHTQSGVLACRSITDPNSVQNLLARIGWDPAISEQPWFIAIVSQTDGESVEVEYAARIIIDSPLQWRLETLPEKPEKRSTSYGKTNRKRRAARIFLSYSHEDEKYKNELIKHLSGLRRKGIIENWHDRLIPPGTDLDEAIDENLRAADIILFLVSSDFLASDYIWKSEVRQAMERNNSGDAVVIPVILREVSWQDTPFGQLLALPTDAKPVVEWPSHDSGFRNVVEGIRSAVQTLHL